MKQIDLNCDLGEGGGYDVELMPLLTSCSIACGGHFGDEVSMLKAVLLAKNHSVKIGAHPSYPDFENFGRESLKFEANVLKNSLKSQIIQLKSIADSNDYPLTHIKPHGALYNDANTKPEIAELLIDTLEELNLSLPLFVAYNSVISKLASGIIDIFVEGFSDRNYNFDYTLVSRELPNAVIKTKVKVANHVLNIVVKNRVEIGEEHYIPIQVDTICMHSDTQNAIASLEYLRRKFKESGVEIKAYND